VQWQRHDRGVELALAQQAQQQLGFFLGQQQFELGETFAQARHHVRQQVGRERGENAQAHGARFGIARAPRDAADLLDLVQHLARALRDFHADLGQQHAPRRALDQGDAQLVLDLLDLRGQGRLADEAGLGRASEMLVFGESHEIAKIAKVHEGRSSGSMVEL